MASTPSYINGFNALKDADWKQKGSRNKYHRREHALTNNTTPKTQSYMNEEMGPWNLKDNYDSTISYVP